MTRHTDTESTCARVLIVDDDQTYLALCQRYLAKDSRYRYEMVTASGATEALAACAESHFDCLLIDYGLPDQTGTDLIGTLRERLGRALPPVVIISADSTANPAIQAVRIHASDFLSKRDVSAEALRRSVGNAVEKGMLQRAVTTRQHELKRANAELERRAVEIQRFYHTVSHEMKTPLTAAREFVAIVNDGLAGPVSLEQQEMLAHALACCDQITTQFNDLIDLTRIETGKMRLERVQTSLANTIARAIAMCSGSANRKSIAIVSDCDESLPPLDIDNGRIVQVLSNLIGNAIKFTPKSGTVTLNAVPSDDGHTVVVSVSDTGCGISESDCLRIFDRLYQVKVAADNSESSGLGLGLSIAREIVHGHGGELSVVSHVGRGSSFQFTLPLISTEQPTGESSVINTETV